MRFSLLPLFCASLLLAGCGPTPSVRDDGSASPDTGKRVLSFRDIQWEQLNPARGDKSPQAGTLWGDRTGPGAAGFILKPIDGFESPPHIHNVAYRGVVISGLLHNDDPPAEKMWMPTGSFWTQPAGGVHITAAKGNDCLAYIEVEDGFGVLPANEAFPSGEQPVNVDVGNLVWLDAAETEWVEAPSNGSSDRGAKIAFLWGEPSVDQLCGAMIKLPAGFEGRIDSRASSLHGVVIQGSVRHRFSGGESPRLLRPGSLFTSGGPSTHWVMSDSSGETLVYLRVRGAFEVRGN